MKRQKKKKTLAFKNAVAGYLFILPFNPWFYSVQGCSVELVLCE